MIWSALDAPYSSLKSLISTYDLAQTKPSPSQMTAHYVTLIAELDKTLSMVRTFWMESRDDNERRKNRIRLDELLDERLRLMAARDAAAEVKA